MAERPKVIYTELGVALRRPDGSLEPYGETKDCGGCAPGCPRCGGKITKEQRDRVLKRGFASKSAEDQAAAMHALDGMDDCPRCGDRHYDPDYCPPKRSEKA